MNEQKHSQQPPCGQEKVFTNDQTSPAVHYDLLPSGAHVTVQRPCACVTPACAHWNGSVLLYAHGHRPTGVSLCEVAHEALHDKAFQQLVGRGWVIAMTSYRHAGVCVTDGVMDMLELRHHVVTLLGNRQPDLCIVEGQSMGGAIATLLAENHPHEFDGVLAVGAALRWRPEQEADITSASSKAAQLLHQPRTPLVFLTNESEVSNVNTYVEECRRQIHVQQQRMCQQRCWHVGPGDEVLLPARWVVQREGHNWTSYKERLEGLSMVISWVRHGTCITRRLWDATFTRRPPTVAASVSTMPDGTPFVRGHVLRVSSSAAVHLSVTDTDLQRLGVGPFGCFSLLKQAPKDRGSGNRNCGDAEVHIRRDVYPYIRAEKGQLMSLDHPDDGHLVVRVNSYAMCQVPAGLRAGDGVLIRRSDMPATVPAERPLW